MKKQKKKVRKVPLGPEIDKMYHRKTFFNDKEKNRSYRKRIWRKEQGI